ncbi:MAG TPA: CGNR zinc finger domain-containing protein [Actinomycetota bacterium]|nr:CGNR zinc finger domain-containing protein [Actinomycetota bacterium]
MIKVTWEWLGQGPALDLADTVTIEDGEEHDLIASAGDYERWARIEARFVPASLAGSLARSRRELIELRTVVRDVVEAVADGRSPARSAIARLNRISRSSPEWVELDPGSLELRTSTSGRTVDRLLAWYARSTLELVASERGRLRRCPAPSCGMFYLSSRPAQRWCSTQCGSRARVARHYARHQAERHTT